VVVTKPRLRPFGRGRGVTGMRTHSVEIARRFCGPPRSANGGYACGRIAAFIDGPAEVTLKLPPPLDKPMRLEQARETVSLFDDDRLVATAISGEVEIADIDAPTFRTALEATERTFAAKTHALPTCFVCGPHRDFGDGLRIHPGPISADDDNWSGLLAAPWIPAGDLTNGDGSVRPEFVWAVLDCPTAYAASSPAGMLPILLGRQAVRILNLPAAGERCVVVSWEVARDGRKFYADACLFGPEGEVLACCNALWIEVDPEVQRGGAQS